MRTSGIAGQCSHALQVATTKYKVRLWKQLRQLNKLEHRILSSHRSELCTFSSASVTALCGWTGKTSRRVCLLAVHSLTNSTYHVYSRRTLDLTDCPTDWTRHDLGQPREKAFKDTRSLSFLLSKDLSYPEDTNIKLEYSAREMLPRPGHPRIESNFGLIRLIGSRPSRMQTGTHR